MNRVAKAVVFHIEEEYKNQSHERQAKWKDRFEGMKEELLDPEKLMKASNCFPHIEDSRERVAYYLVSVLRNWTRRGVW